MRRIALSVHNVVPKRGERTDKFRKLIRELKSNEAIPLTDAAETVGLHERHAQRIAAELKATVSVAVDGKPVVCVANPKTAEKYNAKN